ncbi:class I SAM-dependent methyltransferase [Neolewinella persica]|uniref:class I SAM-dependent methyltransferase n=1 Tax=Neolewinella persica TaxID=70998 RepID=UPI00036C5F45|nr:methyltransferase domain-containing protein [Neolewinella persica]
MNPAYDKYYETENLFGAPYPELLDFYNNLPNKGKLLDIGCGQGRDAIALARLGFEVTGIDNSAVGIAQLNKIAAQERLPLTGVVTDLYAYTGFEAFNYILMDSMFHFAKKEREQEVAFLKRIFREAAPEALITICLQNTGKKVAILNDIISSEAAVEEVSSKNLVYRYEDKASGHSSETDYEMVTVRRNH